MGGRMTVIKLSEIVCSQLGVPPDELRDRRLRERHIEEARALLYYLARKHTRLSYGAIARYSTGVHRSSVRAGYLRVMRDVARRGELMQLARELEALCSAV